MTIIAAEVSWEGAFVASVTPYLVTFIYEYDKTCTQFILFNIRLISNAFN